MRISHPRASACSLCAWHYGWLVIGRSLAFQEVCVCVCWGGGGRTSLSSMTQSQYEVTGPKGQFVQVRVKGDAMEESDHIPRHLRTTYLYVFWRGRRQGVLDKRPSSAAFLSHTIDNAPLRCQCQLLHAGTSESTRLTFKTSDVRSLFIIHSIRRPADAQHPHVQQWGINIQSSVFFFFNPCWLHLFTDVTF